MKLVLLKGQNDRKSFEIIKLLGAEIQEIQDLEETDNKIKELIKKDYKTIIITNELASFSESIIKKYNKPKDIKIIIAPPK